MALQDLDDILKEAFSLESELMDEAHDSVDGDEDMDPPPPFRGDYFGDNYAEEDFPGWNDNNNNEEEEEEGEWEEPEECADLLCYCLQY